MLMTELLMALKSDSDREIEAAIQRRRYEQAARAIRPAQTPETPRPTVADSRAAVGRRPSTGPSAT